MKKTFRDLFINPPAEYRLAPFWFWNHRLEHDEIRWQIQQMHEQGVGGFIIHARYGLATPYMSDEWLKLCETAIEEARRLGMKVYLYDDNDFPSGSAGGKALENHPELRHSTLIVTGEYRVIGGKKFEVDIDVADGMVAVLAVPVDQDRFCIDAVINLTKCVRCHHLSWSAPAGIWSVLICAKKMWYQGANYYLPDYMNPKATDKFIELTHKVYFDRFGNDFGKLIPGIFTDEPAVNYIEPGIPWTESLPDEFSKEHGYDLISILPALFKNSSAQTYKPRCDFWQTVGRLYSKSFFTRIEKFCDKHNLKFIGHLCCEGEMWYQARRQVDFFQCGKHMHFGGMDHLFSKTWPNYKEANDFNNHLTPKMASSVAHLHNKPRTMSECFGLAGQWGVNLRLLKKLTDWQVVLGVNLLMPHAFYYSIAGFRRYECPPSQSYQSPFWPYYRKFADYAGRLCMTFSNASHCAKVAVLYPIKSMWTTNLSGSGPDSRAEYITNGLMDVTASLTRIHHDFDMISEELIQTADISDTIRISDKDISILHEFSVLFIPPITTISRKTIKQVEKFYRKGGSIIFTGSLPDSSVEIGEDSLCGDILASIFGTDNPQHDLIKVKNENGGQAIWLSKTSMNIDFENILSEILTSVVLPEVRICEKKKNLRDIICCKYRKDNSDFYFLVNTSDTETFNSEIQLSSKGKTVQILDAETGQICAVTDFSVTNDIITLNLNFAPVQSYILLVSDNKKVINADLIKSPQKQAKTILMLTDKWKFRPESLNVLPLTEWQLKMTPKSGFVALGAVAHPELCEGTQSFRTCFEVKTDLKQAKLLFDGLVGQYCFRPFNLPFTYNVLVNGVKIDGFENGKYIDHYMKEADISFALKPRTNELIIECKVELFDDGHLINPVLLLGDFVLEKTDTGWSAVARTDENVCGSWTEFGYPFYSGSGTYTQDIKIPKINKGCSYVMRFEAIGDLAEVIINGKSAGTTAWEPLEVDITEYIKRGTNHIEIKVTNSAQNVLTLTPKPSGLLGKVKIVEYK